VGESTFPFVLTFEPFPGSKEKTVNEFDLLSQFSIMRTFLLQNVVLAEHLVYV